MNHKQLILSFLLMTCSLLTASANDGVYFTSGNFLVPTQETDISSTEKFSPSQSVTTGSRVSTSIMSL